MKIQSKINGAVDYRELYGKLENPKCQPMNLDGIYERGGNFVFLECKTPTAPDMETGQRLTLERLAKLGLVLIVQITGKRYEDNGALMFDPTSYEKILPDGSYTESENINLIDFIARLRAWERQVLK